MKQKSKSFSYGLDLGVYTSMPCTASGAVRVNDNRYVLLVRYPFSFIFSAVHTSNSELREHITMRSHYENLMGVCTAEVRFETKVYIPFFFRDV